MRAVYSPASNPAGILPQRLTPGEKESIVEIIETSVTAAAANRTKYVGRAALRDTCCELAHPLRVIIRMSNLESRIPVRSEPKKRIVVAFDVDVISANDDSGRTMSGTRKMAGRRNASCA